MSKEFNNIVNKKERKKERGDKLDLLKCPILAYKCVPSVVKYKKKQMDSEIHVCDLDHLYVLVSYK